eukprot:5979959-Amphidinium_carterae.1
MTQYFCDQVASIASPFTEPNHTYTHTRIQEEAEGWLPNDSNQSSQKETEDYYYIVELLHTVAFEDVSEFKLIPAPQKG